MKTTTYSKHQPFPEYLTTVERIVRTTIGVVLIGSVFVAKGPLDWAVVMPLLGIYPLLTGVMGIEPMRVFLERGSMTYRTVQYTVGGALVGSLFVMSHFSSVPVAEFMILPLVGIYYMLAGIMGQAPLAAVSKAMRREVRMPTSIKAC
jgi:hypothetical protein